MCVCGGGGGGVAGGGGGGGGQFFNLVISFISRFCFRAVSSPRKVNRKSQKLFPFCKMGEEEYFHSLEYICTGSGGASSRPTFGSVVSNVVTICSPAPLYIKALKCL